MEFTEDKTVKELLERYGGTALEKQKNFGNLIGNNPWNADLNKGEISFGAGLTFPIQVLGTFSHAAETWLWAWANDMSDIPANLLKQSLELKDYGEKNGIDLFKNRTFPVTENDLHPIGMIASGMLNASGYYLGNYGQGTICLLIKSEKIDEQFDRANDELTVSTIFPQLISLFEMSHKNALKNYLQLKGYEIEEQGNKITGQKNGKAIEATFDELSRLTNLKGKISPA